MRDLLPQFNAVLQRVKKSRVIAITAHTQPDGDAIGSILGLGLALSQRKNTYNHQEIFLCSRDAVPTSLAFLPGASSILPVLPLCPDLVIGLDYGDVKRLAIPRGYLDWASLITFDHHPYDKQAGEIRIIDTAFSSTAELIFSFLKSQDFKITSDIALCLLTGIFTDTGGFLHANTSASALQAAGELMALGADMKKVFHQQFGGKSLGTLRYWGRLISQMKFDERYKMVLVSVPFDDLEQYGVSADELSGIVSIVNTARESRFSAFLMEHKKGFVKGSLRTEPSTGVDVSVIAKSLGGGGHKCASGFAIEGDIAHAENALNAVLAGHFSSRKENTYRI